MDNYLDEIRKALSSEGAFYIYLKIITNAPKTEFSELMSDEKKILKLRIKAKPKNNKANKEILKFLTKYFDCKAKIISGMTHSIKLVKLFHGKNLS